MSRLLLALLLTTPLLGAQSVAEFARQADTLASRHRQEEAIRILRRGLAKHAGEPSLLMRLGDLLARSGRRPEGLRWLERALARQPHQAEILRRTGEALLLSGQMKRAVSLLEEAARRAPGEASTQHDLAFALLVQGRDREALERARQAVEISPSTVSYRRFYALLLEVNRHPRESLRQLELAFRLDPRDPSLMAELAGKQIRAGRPLQALEYLELAVARDPENPLYHRELAKLDRRLGRRQEARREATFSQDLQAAFRHYLEALRLASRGRRAEAISRLEPVVAARPGFVTGRLLLAGLYHQAGHPERALELYLEVLERQPHHALAAQESAWIEAQRGFPDSALGLLERVGAEGPNTLLLRAYQRMLEEDWGGALELFRSVEQRDPLNPDLLQLISACLEALGRPVQALEALERAQAVSPAPARVRRQRIELLRGEAFRLVEQKRWRPALQALQELLRQDAVRAEYLSRMAYCHQKLGRMRRAIREYRAALVAEPGARWARVNLALSLYLTGRYREAAREWETILAAGPEREAAFQLGLCYFHLERYPEAERALERALELGERSPELLYSLGSLKLRHRSPQAWALIRRAAASGYGPALALAARPFTPR